ncbi:DUF3616 domain-containing protein [Pontibacter akesuensis]|uniref:DUF3616 domain-containing protein n=1 Tax=Pontibacter akesuensis TaxID=388950 RepID=A0A1I7IGC6_9BACT|nr:DUF3616 domain-containing protein [Pontibacter akesuensis]GHA67048.1 hypothetical protein GCM10007389_20220 [Pontibacter akesuensis]SFU71993.1 Protein of unknown function [Pontibacter akesuensis]
MKDKVILQFDPELGRGAEGKHVRNGLSTAFHSGDNIWLSCDERTTVERLTLQPDGSFGKHKSFDLHEYLDLPAKDNSEIDIEGMGMADNYLWLIGSHSLKRSKPKRHDSIEKQIKRLAKVKNDPNRHLLARIPILKDAESGDYTLHKETDDPDQPGRKLRAAQLHGSKTSSILTEMLQDDAHIAPFMSIPGKDNGFDIEGLAIHGNRIFIGLRGPVLRGWAMVLEVEPEEDEKGMLHLKQLANDKPYRKHFLNIRGKGIRELRFFGEDMYLLAGPTMDLDGVIAIYRWRGALSREQEQLLHHNQLERLCEVPHGTGGNTGKDKAEGLAILDDKRVLVVFDSPTDDRLVGEDGVEADVLRVVE